MRSDACPPADSPEPLPLIPLLPLGPPRLSGCRRRLRRRSTALLTLFAVFLLCAAYGAIWDWNALVAHESQLRSRIRECPVKGALCGFVVYTLLCFVPGAGGKSLVMGWLFGFWSALVQVNFGLTIAALTTFWVSRHLIYEAVHRRLGRRVAQLDQAMTVDGPFYLFAMRVLHAPYTITNYALGATSIRSRDFWWATQLGMIPGNVLFVYAGASCPSLSELSQRGIWSILNAPLLLAATAIALAPLLARQGWRKWRQRRNAVSA